jgi:hypothetical protein
MFNIHISSMVILRGMSRSRGRKADHRTKRQVQRRAAILYIAAISGQLSRVCYETIGSIATSVVITAAQTRETEFCDTLYIRSNIR